MVQRTTPLTCSLYCSFTLHCLAADGLPTWFVSTAEPTSPYRTSSDTALDDELKNGKFGVVRSLLRVLEGGAASKAVVDTVIDACK